MPRFDRDICEWRRNAPDGQPLTAASREYGRRAQPVSRSVAASRSAALPLTHELATHDGGPYRTNDAENAISNRFARSELCSECGLRFADSNYVATTAEGRCWCGDCWDAYLGVTLVIPSNLHPIALCECGRDLRAEPWFTVDLAAQQTPYCRSCSLSYWSMSGNEFAVTIIPDGNITVRSSHGEGSNGLQRRPLAVTHYPGLLQWTLSLLTLYTTGRRFGRSLLLVDVARPSRFGACGSPLKRAHTLSQIEVGLAPDPKVYILYQRYISYTKSSCLCTRYRGRLRPKGIYFIPQVYILYQSSCLCTRYSARAYARASIS